MGTEKPQRIFSNVVTLVRAPIPIITANHKRNTIAETVRPCQTNVVAENLEIRLIKRKSKANLKIPTNESSVRKKTAPQKRKTREIVRMKKNVVDAIAII